MKVYVLKNLDKEYEPLRVFSTWMTTEQFLHHEIEQNNFIHVSISAKIVDDDSYKKKQG